MNKNILALLALFAFMGHVSFLQAAPIPTKSDKTTATSTSTKQPLSDLEKMQLQMQGVLDKQGKVIPPAPKEITGTAPPAIGNEIHDPVTIIPPAPAPQPAEVQPDSDFRCPQGYYCKTTNGGFLARCILGNAPVPITSLQFSQVQLSNCNDVATMCRAMQNDPSIKNPEVWGAYCKD